jgi:hypothetical protein
MYRRLAKREEAEMAERFGSEWEAYKARTGMFLPRLRGPAGPVARRSAKPARGGPERAAKSAVLALAVLSAAAPGASAQELAWKSYGEAGLGLSLAGGAAHPMMSLDSGIALGPVELGVYLDVVPTEFGSPDLIQVGFARWGGSIGASLDLALPFSPFARIGLGAIGQGRVPEGGSGALGDFKKSFDCSLVVGLGLPLGGRWSARAWASWSLAPSARDYDGRPLSGPSFGLSLRAAWETILR